MARLVAEPRPHNSDEGRRERVVLIVLNLIDQFRIFRLLRALFKVLLEFLIQLILQHIDADLPVINVLLDELDLDYFLEFDRLHQSFELAHDSLVGHC